MTSLVFATVMYSDEMKKRDFSKNKMMQKLGRSFKYVQENI